MEYVFGAVTVFVLVAQALETRSVVLAAFCGFGAGAIGIFALVLVFAYFDTGVWQLPSDVGEHWKEFAFVGGLWGTLIGGAIVLVRKTPAFLRNASGVLSEVGNGVAQSRRERKSAGQQAYHVIARELEEGRIESPTWVKAFENSGGNEDRAKAEYIRLRRRRLLETWMSK